MSRDKPEVAGRVSSGAHEQQKSWFLDHYHHPAEEIEKFLEGTSVSIEGRRVLDVGCGDGIIDVGVTHRLRPARLHGVDIAPPDITSLQQKCREFLNQDIPSTLTFGECHETSLPIPDATYDFVMSWSVFEHVSQPQKVMSEIRRVLRPGGYMFLQIWPLYRSQRGSHLWAWYPDGWEHLTNSHTALREDFVKKTDINPELHRATLTDFDSLNQMTLQGLQRIILSAGLSIRRVHLQSDLIDVPRELQAYDLADLTTSGVKILAARDY